MLQTKVIYLLNHEIVEQIVAPGLFQAAMSKLFAGGSKSGTEALVVSSGEFKEVVEQLQKEDQNESTINKMRNPLAAQKTLVLISGTSGCGKTTISYNLANRLDKDLFPLSTDSIRHALRNQTTR